MKMKAIGWGVCLLAVLLLVAAITIGDAFASKHPQNDAPIPVKIDNTVTVYYVGDGISEYFLRAIKVTEFRKLKAPHILMVGSSWTENNSRLRHFIREEVLSGIPVIMVKSNPELLKGTFEGQFYPRVVNGQKPDGTPLGKETVYGYVTYPLPNGILVTKVFISTDPSPRAIEGAYNWAVENLQPNAGSIEVESPSSGAYRVYRGQLDFTTGDDWKPYGRLNVRTLYYKLIDDGSSVYDWYNVHVRQQSTPGRELWSDSDWKTAGMYTWIDADYYNPNGFLSAYSPTTIYGAKSVSISLPEVTGSRSWSYKVPDVVVHDQSDYSQELAKWWHEVAEDKGVGSATYQIEPGAILRFLESEPKEWREHYGAEYGKPPDWWEPGWYWDRTNEGWVEFQISMG